MSPLIEPPRRDDALTKPESPRNGAPPTYQRPGLLSDRRKTLMSGGMTPGLIARPIAKEMRGSGPGRSRGRGLPRVDARPDDAPIGAIRGPSTSFEGLSWAGTPPGSSAPGGASPAPAPGSRWAGIRVRTDAPGGVAADDRDDEDAPERPPGPHDQPEQARDDQAAPEDGGVQLVACSHASSSRNGPGLPRH